MRVKICGLTRPGDAQVAADAGASYLGAVLSRGFTRTVDAAVAAEFSRGGGTVVVAVVVDEGVAGAATLARRAGAGVIQLHGDEGPEELRALAGEGDWRLWKALGVRSPAELPRALERYHGVAHGILLEGHGVGRGGGRGRAFPWGAVAELRDGFPDGMVFVLAGGLTPLNVAEAVRLLRPDVVDTSSGVEVSPGAKDPQQVAAFVKAALAAPAEPLATSREVGR